MSFLEFTEDEKQSAGSPVAEVDKNLSQSRRPNYKAALAWAGGTLLAAGVLLYIAAPKNSSQPSRLPLTTASQAEAPQVIAKNVEDIQAGDVVVSYDETTGEQVFNRVVETYERTSFHLRFIETRSLESGEVQTFETTDEHPFWKVDIGWIDAGKLQPGDQLLQHNGQFAEVVSTRYEAHPEGVTVYNFQVADSHSYYVSAPTTRGPPVLVHNANGYRVMSPDEFKTASHGNWADSDLVKGDPTESGRKWLWGSEDDARSWLDFIRANGEDGIITVVPTKRPLTDYPSFPHPPQGPAIHVPFDDLGPAVLK